MNHQILVASLLSALLSLPAADAQPWLPERPAMYQVSGEVTVLVDGDIDASGFFQLDYEVAGTSQVTLLRLTAELRDFVLVSEGFLGLFAVRTPFLCNQAALTGPAFGTLDAAGRLEIPVGGASLFGASRKERDAAGGCEGTLPNAAIAAVNTRGLVGLHNPAGDHFSLGGSFTGEADGRTFPVEIHLSGRYLNRPPSARLASTGPGIDFSQGGCPGSLPNAPAVEANTAGGLRLSFRSLATDPDGPYPGADLVHGRWERWDGARLDLLGAGEELADVHFALGGPHGVAHTVFDRAGAASVASCSFTVADTLGPQVTPPSWTWTYCTVPGGATRETSPALAAWLAGAAVSDVADPAPAALAPQVGGLPVGETTLFPTGVWSWVDFRAQDASGNLGTSGSWVWIASRPELYASWTDPSSGTLPATNKLLPVSVALATPGCGYASVELVAIRSNGPEPIETLVAGAGWGTPDPTFYLHSSLVTKPSGGLIPRVYEVEYRATGVDGQVGVVVLALTVGG